jgi:hypothetical protein
MCAEQAELSFKKDGFKKDDPENYAFFMSHYDEVSHICFIGIEQHRQLGQTLWTYRFVSDAIGGQSYGAYSWHTVENKKYWEVPPVDCKIRAISGEMVSCKDDDEFDDLARKHFGIFFK